MLLLLRTRLAEVAGPAHLLSAMYVLYTSPIQAAMQKRRWHGRRQFAAAAGATTHK